MSEQSLRDALEKLAGEWEEQPSSYLKETAGLLRDLLRFHPAEPALAVADVTAAVKAIKTGKGSEQYQHGRDTMREDVLLAIDSLTPGVEW